MKHAHAPTGLPDLPDLIDRRLAQLARRQRAAARLRVLLPALAVAAGLAAIAVIAVRLALPEAAVAAPWLAAAAALPLLAAPFLGRRRARPAQLAAALDTLVDARGLLMGLAADPAPARDPRWVARLQRPLEALRWPRHDWRQLPLAAAAAVCLLGALLVPQRLPDAPPPAPPWQVHFERVEQRLAATELRGLVPKAEQARLAEQLARLEAHAARSGMSQVAWEGLDRLERDLDRALAEAQARLAEAIAAARTAASPRAGDPAAGSPEAVAADAERRRRERDRLKPKTPPPADPAAAAAAAAARERQLERLQRDRVLDRLTREREDERLSHLAQRLADLAAVAPGLVPPLDGPAAEALRQALEQAGALDGLSPAQREALERLLREASASAPQPGPPQPGGPTPEAVARALEQLREALAQGSATLGQLGVGGDLGAQVARLSAGLLGPSQGASVSRGPGHVALASGQDPGVAPDPARVTALPPGAHPNPDGSITLAVTSRDPELDPVALEALSRGAVQVHDPTVSDARRAHVAPRHRGAVSRYFARETP